MTWLTQDRSRLDAFRRGDREVLAQVYARYAGSVGDVLRMGFSFHSGGEPCRFHGFYTPFELDDALQETFARAFSDKGRVGYDGVRPFRNYLLTIARNLVIDGLRRRKHEPRLFTRGEQETPEPGSQPASASPEHEAMVEQLRRLIAAFKGALSDTERALFELRFEQGLARAEICQRLELSPMQVRTRERKLRERMLQRLEAAGFTHAGDLQAVLLLWLLLAAGLARWGGHAL